VRVTRAHEIFIAPGEHVFAFGGSASRLLGNVVSVSWTLVSRADGEKAGGGLNVLALGGDGRIRIDYQFSARRPGDARRGACDRDRPRPETRREATLRFSADSVAGAAETGATEGGDEPLSPQTGHRQQGGMLPAH
jgi:hypothetical protein